MEKSETELVRDSMEVEVIECRPLMMYEAQKRRG